MYMLFVNFKPTFCRFAMGGILSTKIHTKHTIPPFAKPRSIYYPFTSTSTAKSCPDFGLVDTLYVASLPSLSNRLIPFAEDE